VSATSGIGIEETKAMETCVEAVIYGLPLVMMDLTQKRNINVKRPHGIAAPINQFGHAPIFPPASFKDVVRANVDTLYSSAFLDLSSEPQILSVPDTGGRYYVMPMLDAWTNVFATPGARTTGTKSADFVITGPGWTGKLPEGMQEIKSPTNTVWVLGRTQTNGPGDYPAVHAIQAGFRLSPLSRFGGSWVSAEGDVDLNADMKTPPVKQLEKMSGIEYFGTLARLLAANPPPVRDAPILGRLASIGVVPGQPFEPTKLNSTVAKELEGVVPRALAKLQGEAKSMGAAVNGWRIPKKNIAAFGTDYDTRAFIALIALGANLPEDALYPTTFVDGQGHLLNGGNRYVLHFDAGLTPPVNTFWSVTMYDQDSFFVENPIHRYAISSWMPLKRNADGSLDIYIQHESPGADEEGNWLPAPEGAFNLTLRMYWPKAEKPSILDGTWTPPSVTKAQ
jgi:DNA sulfur modification protein DndE